MENLTPILAYQAAQNYSNGSGITYPHIIEADRVCACLPVEVPWCVEGYGFPTIYSSQNAIFSFTDKFSKKYYISVEIDEHGWAVVDKNFLPAELLNPYAGEFIVEFWDATDIEKKKKFFFDGEKVYNCLLLRVVDIFAHNLTFSGVYNVSLKMYYCCCERLCPPPKPDCADNKITFSLH